MQSNNNNANNQTDAPKNSLNRLLWKGWRQEASVDLGIAPNTAKLWYDANRPILMDWLYDKLTTRMQAQEEANNKKTKIIEMAHEINSIKPI